MKNKKATTEEQKLQQQKQADARIKAFIQALDIKRDTNMTRIYSVICKNEPSIS